MSTGGTHLDSASQAPSVRSEKLNNHLVQAQYLTSFEILRIVYADLGQTRAMKEVHRVGRELEQDVQDMVGREDALENDVPVGREGFRLKRLMPDYDLQSDGASPLFRCLHNAIRDFNRADKALDVEADWTDPVVSLLRGVLEGTKTIVAHADCDMANDVLQALHPGPPAKPSLVKPDGLVGLCREHIRIALNSESRALPHTINSYIMTLRSKSVFVWYGLNNALTSKHYFDYVNIELNGPNGSAGEARIQNTIANYISLRIPFHLANLARHASPNEFRPPTDAMRRVYGLQTGMGGGVWKVVVMEARGAEKSKEAGEEVEAEASALRNCNAQQLGQAGREDYEHMIYTVSTLWEGSVLDPTSLLTLIPLLKHIGSQASERYDIIGNWLHCLRRYCDDQSVSANKQTTRAPVVDNAPPSPGKRSHPDVDEEKRNPRKGRSGKPKGTSRTANHSPAVQSLYLSSDLFKIPVSDKTTSVKTWVESVRSDSGGSELESGIALQ